MLHRIAIISVHTCPLADFAERDTGGMNVFVRHLSTQLGDKGIAVDIFTRLTDKSLPRVVQMAPDVNIIRIQAGSPKKIDKYEISTHLEQFIQGVDAYRQNSSLSYDLIYTNYWLSGYVGVYLKKRWNVPLIHTYHTMALLKDMVKTYRETPKRLERIKIEQEILKHINAIITSNPQEKTFLTSTYNYPDKNIYVIPLGVDTTLFYPLPCQEAKNYIGCADDRIVLYVGRIHPVKGIEWLIHAFKDVTLETKKLKLLIVGGHYGHEYENSYLNWLKRLTVELSLERSIDFTGPKNQTILPYYYCASDVCVIPSLYESFGIVALESMACGTPVIASDTGGLSTAVAHGLTGFLVPPGDSQQLSFRLKQILSDHTLRESLRKQALTWIKKFNWQEVTQSFINVLNKFKLINTS